MRYWIRFYRNAEDTGSHIGAATPVEADDATGAANAIKPADIETAKRAGARWLVVFNKNLAPVKQKEI